MIDYIDKKYFLLAVAGNPRKDISSNDIAVKCPICGDSKIHRNEKRLHLYEKNGKTKVHCFNGDCSVGNTNVYGFLKSFYPELFNAYKREKFNQNLSRSEDVFEKFKAQQKKVLTQDLSNYFQPLTFDAIEYINKRGYTYNSNDFGTWYSGKNPLKIGERIYYLQDCLIIPLYYNNEMYGFYSRSIKDKKFYTYMNESNIGYKIWNWFNINKSEPCYIFEGIFDAISAWMCGLKNVIACMGASIPQERIDELKHPIFCLDNDRTGLNNMLKYSKKYSVIAWNNEYKDCNEMLQHKIDVKQEIENNVYTGILAEVKIRAKL